MLSTEQDVSEAAAVEVSCPRLSMVHHPPPAEFLAPDSAVALATQQDWVDMLKQRKVVSAEPGKESFAVIKVSGAQHK
eukprot:2159677-Prorocentrum_lima.AAC.1